MRDVQKPDHKSLNSIIDRLRDGRYVIPDFQREFEWKPWDIRDLKRSIFLDYYIGSLLLWRGKPETFDALACESIYGYENQQPGEREHIVLDGQQRLTAAIQDLLIKERLDLAPDVRELDARVEDVELRLRKVVWDDLDHSVEQLPPHLRDRIDQRIRTAARRNPALDLEHYDTLEGKLECADLRELEAVIVNKQLWSTFERRFGGKSVLSQKFDQLAELRNAIRHSRSVNAVVRGEGEAAIIWFERVLQ